jgi:hypothetical protein
VRDWVVRFNARGPTGLIDGKAPGGRPLLSDDQRRALARVVEDERQHRHAVALLRPPRDHA